MSQQTTAFYNHFSLFYPLVDLFLKPQKHRLFNEVNKQAAGKLLEIGVGNGAHLRLYNKHLVTGIDTSAEMLKHAHKNSPAGTRLLLMDGAALEFENDVFDYVVLSHVIAVVANPERLLHETHRVLKPGGKLFILNHFTPDNPLRLIDEVFQPVAKKLRFRSVFRRRDIITLKKFTLQAEINAGIGSYFKILICQK